MNKKNHDRKHLTLSQRIIIEKGLTDHESFSAIARKIGKDPGTVSKEVRNHLIESVVGNRYDQIPCQFSKSCTIKGLCTVPCSKPCRMCPKPFVHCKSLCSEYKEKTCDRLSKPPYCCNGCTKKGGCNILRRSIHRLGRRCR